MIDSNIIVSVIIPVYNAEKYLVECITSVLAQSIKNIEIILVDDGSSDSSGEICNSFAAKDERIIVIHKENGGVSSARNIGLYHCSGEWVCFVDSDDTISPLFLENLLDNENYDLLIGGIKCFGIIDEVIQRKSTEYVSIKDLGVFTSNILNSRSVFYYSCGKLFRNSIIKENNIQFNKELKMCEDTCFNMEYVSCSNSIVVTKYSDYNYRNLGIPKRIMDYDIYFKHIAIYDTYHNKLSNSLNTGFNLLYSDIHKALLNQFVGFTLRACRKDFFNSVRFFRRNLLAELLYLKQNSTLKYYFLLFSYRFPFVGFYLLKIILKIRESLK